MNEQQSIMSTYIDCNMMECFQTSVSSYDMQEPPAFSCMDKEEEEEGHLKLDGDI